MSTVHRSLLCAACSMVATAMITTAASSTTVPEVIVWEAEASKIPGSAQLFADDKASGKKCVAVIFDTSPSKPQELFSRTESLPPGLYEVTFRIDAQPLEVMHGLEFTLQAGKECVTLHSIHFEGDGHYREITLRTRHEGWNFTVRAAAASASGFNGMRAGQGAGERELLERAAQTTALSDDPTAAFLAELDAVSGERDVRDTAMAEHRAWIDKVEIRCLTPYSVPLTLDVDKIHYAPGETVRATYKLLPFDGIHPWPWRLTAVLVTELDTTLTVWSGDVIDDTPEGAFSFTLPPEREFGHELRLQVKGKGVLLGESVTIFGVSSNVYRIAITANAGPQNTQNFSLERGRALMADNRRLYANHFERFAWAPCDYSDLDPAEELFYSGQTQYHGSRTGMKNLINAAHEVGIKAITYGKACGGGIAGFNTLQCRPELFAFNHAAGAFVCESLNVFFLERMLANGYNAGPPEKGGWQHWATLWTNYGSNPNTVTFGAEAIIASVRSFGWDGVRWDGHFTGHQKPFIEKLRAFNPSFVHGYNIAFANPAADSFMPPDQDDFHEVAAGGGLMMDESTRDWSNTNFSPGWHDRFYTALCREADYIKAVDGLPLIIVFDMASRLDTHLNVATAIAAGQRYTYLTSPGDYAYGSLSKWLTRFSAFVWDQSRRFEESAVTVSETAGGGLFWRDSIWLRHAGDNIWQVLVPLINRPLYKQFCNRVQPPPQTATDIEVSFALPAGATFKRSFYLSPELATGWSPLETDTTDLQGRVTVTLPPLHFFGIAGFTFEWSGTGTPFRLTDPVGIAAAVFAEKAAKIAEKAAAAKAAAGIGAPAAETVATTQTTTDQAWLTKNSPPAEWRLERDGKPDILHARGPFSWLNPVEGAAALIKGARLTPSWVDLVGFKLRDNGCMDEFPDSWEALAKFDVAVLDNVHARYLGIGNRTRIAEFVRHGGGLLVFGGYWNLSSGHDRGTALADLLPVDVSTHQPIHSEPGGMRLTPTSADFFSGVDFNALGKVLSCDTSAPRANATILATVNGRPAIVAGEAGAGRVITILINPHGELPPNTSGYWQSVEWLKVISTCLRWLSAGAENDIRNTVKTRTIVADKPQPADLLVRAAFGMNEETFTKQLRASLVNIIDTSSARAALETLAENSDKLGDPDLATDTVTAATPFFSREMAATGAALCQSTLPSLRAAGYAIIGHSGDPVHVTLLKKGLSDRDRSCVREAIAGLGRLGTAADGAAAVAAYLQRPGSGERLLALTTLLAAGDTGHLNEAWREYETGLQRAVDLKCGTFAMVSRLWGGTSFKMTPIQRKQAMVEYRSLLKTRREVADDNSLFFATALSLTGSPLQNLASLMATSERHEIQPLAFALIGNATAADATALRQTFANAKLPALRLLSNN